MCESELLGKEDGEICGILSADAGANWGCILYLASAFVNERGYDKIEVFHARNMQMCMNLVVDCLNAVKNLAHI
jgi:hypothetical protein